MWGRSRIRYTKQHFPLIRSEKQCLIFFLSGLEIVSEMGLRKRHLGILQELTKDHLVASFLRLRDVLVDGGLAFHSFWYGDKEEDFDGLHFVYYTEDELLRCVGSGFEVVTMERYKEMEEGDSFCVLFRVMKC
jgi:hypothetical protein